MSFLNFLDNNEQEKTEFINESFTNVDELFEAAENFADLPASWKNAFSAAAEKKEVYLTVVETIKSQAKLQSLIKKFSNARQKNYGFIVELDGQAIAAFIRNKNDAHHFDVKHPTKKIITKAHSLASAYTGKGFTYIKTPDKIKLLTMDEVSTTAKAIIDSYVADVFKGIDVNKFLKAVDVTLKIVSEVPTIVESKERLPQLQTKIVDSCREAKVSIRAVEQTKEALNVHYNYGNEAPEGYVSNKNDVCKIVKDIVSDILYDYDTAFTPLRSNSSEYVGIVTFVFK